MWFLYAERRFWFSTRPDGPIPRAALNGSDVAVIIDDFSPPDKIRQVRIRGRGQTSHTIQCRLTGSIADTSEQTKQDGPSSFDVGLKIRASRCGR
jgi:hypothetical protein